MRIFDAKPNKRAKDFEMQATDRLLTSAEAAKILGISPRKLWTLTDLGEIRVILIPPRSKRYDVADLRDFINRCKDSGSGQEHVAANATNS